MIDQNRFENRTSAQSGAQATPPRDEVRNLQRYLRTLSYVYDTIPPLPVDGIFDTDTRDALIAFQKLAGLPETGEADRTTWELLYSAYLDALFGASEPLGLPIFPISPSDYTVKRGDTGFTVAAIQYLLWELRTIYDFPIAITVNGIYDESTEQAVKETQRAFLLPLSGEVDKRLWNYLVGAYRAEDTLREQSYGRI